MKIPQKKEINKATLGELCSMLVWANNSVYHYENKKWQGRKDKIATSKQIDNWDEISRKWNEARSQIKNRINDVIKDTSFKKEKKKKTGEREEEMSFDVLPISLMIDMLIIENIKLYDLTLKNKKSDIKKVSTKKKEIEKMIDKSMDNIARKGYYDFQTEIRTF